MDIPEDVLRHGIKSAVGADLLRLGPSCKRYQAFFAGEQEVMIKRSKKIIVQLCPPVILELFGGIENLVVHQELEWKEKYRGGTDYIDRIKAVRHV